MCLSRGIHEDYVTKAMFTLTEWLASPGATNFKTELRNVIGRTEHLLQIFLHVWK